MLHDPGDNYILSVTDCIHLCLSALQILVYKYRMFLRVTVYDLYELLYLII